MFKEDQTRNRSSLVLVAVRCLSWGAMWHPLVVMDAREETKEEMYVKELIPKQQGYCQTNNVGEGGGEDGSRKGGRANS